MSKIFTRPFNPITWGGSPHDFTKDATTGEHNLALGPHTVESTQRYVYGTRYITWDGRVFKYYNAEGATYSYRAAHRIAGGSACAVYVNAAVVTQIGDRSITWTTQGAARVEDDMAGGHAFIYDKSSTNGNIQRGIVGNEASGATYTTLYLDYPLEIAIEITTPDAMEIFENPFSDLSFVANGYVPWMGIPTRNATAGQKGWLQTWGPCVLSGGSGSVPAPDAHEREFVFGDNGSLFTAKDLYASGYQTAGYNLVVGTAAYGPLFMLMCST